MNISPCLAAIVDTVDEWQVQSRGRVARHVPFSLYVYMKLGRDARFGSVEAGVADPDLKRSHVNIKSLSAFGSGGVVM